MGYRSRLQPVELVQRAIDGRVRNEVEGVLGLASLLRLVGERAAPRKAVVHLPDQIGIAQRLAPELGRQHHGELAKVSHLGSNVDILRLVHQDAEEGLRGARILDCLGGKEHLLRGAVVERPVERSVWRSIRPVGRVLEEENHPVQRLQSHQFGGVESEQLFELDIFDAEVLDERREDALFRRNGNMARQYEVCIYGGIYFGVHTASDSTVEEARVS